MADILNCFPLSSEKTGVESNYKRGKRPWLIAKSAGSTRKANVWSVISGLNHTVRHAHTILLTVLETILTSSNARTAGFILAGGAVNAIAAHIRHQASAVSVQSADKSHQNYLSHFQKDRKGS